MIDTLDWTKRLDVRVYVALALLSLVAVAAAAFQIIPSYYPRLLSASLAGSIWMVSFGVVMCGRHVPFRWSATFALILAGMTLTIPSMRLENPVDSPVYQFGVMLSRMGFASLVCQVAFDLRERFKMEHGK